MICLFMYVIEQQVHSDNHMISILSKLLKVTVTEFISMLSLFIVCLVLVLFKGIVCKIPLQILERF